MPRGFHLLMAAQFASALADNALLIVAIAVLHAQGLPPWWAPLLKFALVFCYVALAPLLGPLADAMPKARLMAWMNGVKIIGLLAMAAGVHPVAAFAIVGFGAAAYAPAKYGLVTEIVPPARLVAANGWIEVTVVCAVLLGTVLGGALVTDVLRGSAASQALREAMPGVGLGAGGDLTLSIVAVLAIYALAALLPLLPAKQRDTHPNDWMTTDVEIAGPDPNCGARYRITRTKRRRFRHAETTAVPLPEAAGG